MTAVSQPVLRVYRDADRLAAEAADHIIASAGEAVRARGRFTLALAGGSTPEKTYSLLAEPARAPRIDWSKVFLFFGDERYLPPEDSRSNFNMARRALLNRVAVPPGQVFPIPTDCKDPAESAAVYARTLATAFGVPPDGPPPRFDLVLLGLGDDGHTASLFPGAAALNEDRAWVTSSPPGVLPPPVDRVTLTFPVLNAAYEALFLVAGEKKAGPLHDVMTGKASRVQMPAAGVRPTDGALVWLVDRAAARLVRPAS